MNGTSQQLNPAVEAKPARFVISAQVEGFPVSIEVEGKAEALKAMIERLKAIGAEPPAAPIRAAAQFKLDKIDHSSSEKKSFSSYLPFSRSATNVKGSVVLRSKTRCRLCP